MHALKPRKPHAAQHTPPGLLPESPAGRERSMEATQEGAAEVIDLEGSDDSSGTPLSPPLSPTSAAAMVNARWNPTKEQVSVLEGLYEHGLRTPSAEQIKQITARLREHGHIEGKNVFYWFQNHKARQRQKRKQQDSFAYFTRLLRRPPPLPMLVGPPGPLRYPHGRLPVPATTPAMAVAPPPAAACSNDNGGTHVMYRAPFHMPAAPQAPAANALYYHPQQQVPAPAMYQRVEVAQDKMILVAAQHNHHPAAGTMYHAAAAGNNPSTTPMPHVLHFPPAAAADAGPSRETLQLFPLQPTFLLPADKGRAGGGASMSPVPSTASASFSGESESLEESPDSNGEAPAVPFYDFFDLQSGGR